MIFGLESFLTRLCVERGTDPLDFRAREEADAAFQAKSKADNLSDGERQTYWNLKNLRNAMAHCTEPSKPFVRKLVQYPDHLRAEIESLSERPGRLSIEPSAAGAYVVQQHDDRGADHGAKWNEQRGAEHLTNGVG